MAICGAFVGPIYGGLIVGKLAFAYAVITGAYGADLTQSTNAVALIALDAIRIGFAGGLFGGILSIYVGMV